MAEIAYDLVLKGKRPVIVEMADDFKDQGTLHGKLQLSERLIAVL